MTRTRLAEAYDIPRLIKGGWQLAGGHGPVDHQAALDDMFAFVDAGVDAFDCADIYTGVETLIGAFLAALRRRDGAARAARVRVHTKYVPDRDRLPTLSRADVVAGIDRSLRRLGVERLDLVQFHWWDFDVPGWVDAAGWLDELRRAGKIGHLGVTNCDVPHLAALIDAGLPIVSQQVQYSVLDRRPAHAMAAYCQAHGIHLLCYGGLAGGFLSTRWLGHEAPDEPLEHRSLVKYRLIIEEFGGWPLFQELLAVLTEVGARHGVGPGTVAVRWVLQQPQVAAVIVGARHTRHLADTLAVEALTLTSDDMAAIGQVQTRAVGPAGDVYHLERVAGGRHASIMRYNLQSSGA